MIDQIEAIEAAALENLQAAATDELRTRLKTAADNDGARLISMAGALPTSAIVLSPAAAISTHVAFLRINQNLVRARVCRGQTLGAVIKYTVSVLRIDSNSRSWLESDYRDSVGCGCN